MLLEAPEPHYCNTPESEEIPLRSLFRCDDCERRWILKPGDFGKYWVMLRWYHTTSVVPEADEESGWEWDEVRKDRRAFSMILGLALLIAVVAVFVLEGVQ
jgi:hypothetical protein